MWKKYLKKLNLPESFISITLGFLVLIVGGVLLYNNFTKNKEIDLEDGVNQIEEQKQSQTGTNLVTHKVAEGESLWSIAQVYYNSGYNWVSIAQANNLTNPDKIEAGQELSIPKAETITQERTNILEGSEAPVKTYTVVRGDNLWNIAVRQYGDGFAWTKIAQENHLVNPDIIHAGNVLTLPR